MDSEQTRKGLSAPFPPEQVRTREGRAGMKLQWVEARLVAQRLNEVIGVGAWSFEVSEVAGHDNVVKGKLSLPGAVYEDYGYETGGSGETLKEASSDALRRCASLTGVAAYLYAHGAESNTASSPRPFSRPAIEAAVSTPPSLPRANESILGCPDHHEPYVFREGGVSKTTGKPYDGFWTCKGKTPDGGFCRSKPPRGYNGSVAERPAPAAAPAARDDEADLNDLPF
jgi:hypothetical protein